MENKNIQKTTAEESSDIFAVAEDQDKKNAAIDYAAFVMQLARPLVHDEKTYTELTFNFEDLSGNDSLAIERELQMLGHTVIVANFDSEYLIRVCVKACTEKLGLDALGKLSIRVWLCRQCLAMARTNNTPVDFWLSLRLGEFSQWVKASNALIAEEMEKRKQKRK